MIKFLKYDIKGTLKMLLGFLLGEIFASFAVNCAIFIGKRDESNIFKQELNKINVAETIGIIGGLIGVIVVISFVAYSIYYFYKEICTNQKYLTFQTPQKSWKIIASKLIVMGAWSMIYIIAGTFINAFLVGVLNKEVTNEVVSFIKHFEISSLIIYLGEILSILSIVYMCVTFQKVIVANRKVGSLWFVLLIVILYIYTQVRTLVYTPPSYILEPGQALYLFKGFDLIEGREFIKLIFNAVIIFISTFTGGIVLDKCSDI